ncbi:putative chorismate pyruvate-lyase [Alishewanella longhuensis]|uniref:Probable chorismate pyruvate-lyase n=1 Tax=Alishewanella longhuensis TaxID=1091037 RepID=A0ABQ3L1P8_9ALTE|nr:chorismate lyase [Alishewanella longhuensis]GHG76292.1 putative chorismate pyruvate-lyase [Alishewanella longhuensis]
MTAVLSLDARWQLASLSNLPVALSPWLLESASLTARLKAHSSTFRLQLLGESKMALPAFLQPCFPEPTGDCIRREVLMWCNHQPAVYAQSWLPAQSLQHLQQFALLGEQPLGELLFQFADVVRSPIEVAQLSLLTTDYPIAAADYWARRSVFTVAGQPLLVAEVFLPGVQQLCIGS